jgi:hypothetical protein
VPFPVNNFIYLQLHILALTIARLLFRARKLLEHGFVSLS